MSYAEQMSNKIMQATDKELEEISDEIEFEIYDGLTPQAKARLSKYL